MNVYIAQRWIDYEGFDVLGVFTTEEAAKNCCVADVDSRGFPCGDSHEVTCHEVRDCFIREGL